MRHKHNSPQSYTKYPTLYQHSHPKKTVTVECNLYHIKENEVRKNDSGCRYYITLFTDFFFIIDSFGVFNFSCVWYCLFFCPQFCLSNV